MEANIPLLPLIPKSSSMPLHCSSVLSHLPVRELADKLDTSTQWLLLSADHLEDSTNNGSNAVGEPFFYHPRGMACRDLGYNDASHDFVRNFASRPVTNRTFF